MTGTLDRPTRKLLILTQHSLELWVAPQWFGNRLRKEFPNFDITQLNSYDDLNQYMADVEVTFCSSLPPAQFLLAKKLRWIHSQSAAVNQLMFPELVKSDVIVTNARDVHGPVVAEQVMAMIFALAKHIPSAVRF